jgi:nucleoside-diphosphate-sugar epimerase
MRSFFATGQSGTIGRHLGLSAIPVSIDLASEHNAFQKLKFPNDSNLLHLGGIVGVSEVERNIQRASKINVDGSKFLAERFIENSRGKFYFVSTSHVYDLSEEPISESYAINPSSSYAEQKLEAEIELRKIFSSEPERLCTLRVFSVLDWDVAPFSLGGAIKRLASREKNFTLRNTDDIRDFLTPSTLGKILTKIVLSNELSGVVNLASGVGISVAQAAKRMLDLTGEEFNPAIFEKGNSANPIIVADIRRLLSTFPELNLGWDPSKFPKIN